MVTSEQIRAARALLRLEQDELARRAHVSVVTIRRLEAAEGPGRVSPATVEAVRRVMERAGAEFIEHGVRRRQPPRPEADALFNDLQAISRASAAQLTDRTLLTDADLYGDDGLPA
jgi:transcriptional regulator with XRE-family HTH domain